MDRTKSTGIAVVALGGVAVAIAAVQAQAGVLENWTLTSVDGAPLPYLAETEDGCSETVTAGSLSLRDDGTWLLTLEEEDRCPSGSTTETDTEDGRYAVDGTTIQFLDDDGEPESPDGVIELEDLATGERGANELTVRLADGVTEVRFSR